METQEANPSQSDDIPKKETGRWASFGEIGGLIRLQWPRYLVDIIVIILGISISFLLDNRKDEASRAASEQVYLKSLLEDFDSDIEELQDVIAQTKKVIDKGNAILLLTDYPEKPVKDLNQFSNDFKEIVARPNFVSKDATFSDLKSSGNMQLLTDTKLKSGLFSYYRLYESNRAVEISERETVNAIIAPYLMRQFSIKGMRRPSDDSLTVNQTVSILKKGIELRQVLGDNEFSNTVTLRVISRLELLGGYQQELELAHKIRTRLEQGLADKN